MNEAGKRAWKAFTEAQTIWGLLPGALTSGVIAFSSYIVGFDAPQIALYALAAWALVEFILWRATDRNIRIFAITLLAVGSLAVLYNSYRQAEIKNSQYKLESDGYNVLREGRTLPSGEKRVTSINFVAKVANNNNFPVFYRVDRRYVTFNGKSTFFTDQNQKIEYLAPNFEIQVVSNSLDGELENGKYHSGRYDYVIYYGRDRQNLDHRYSDAGRFNFFLCPISAYICGPVGSSAGETKNEIIGKAEVIK